MRICLMLEGQEGIAWEQWLALATAAEAAGLDALFRSDHYRSILRGEPAGSLDAWATLAALAARTDRIRLGTLVSPVTFRPPAVLAKNAVTVDHISSGRAELGVGAGWYEPEHEAYGLPFLTARGRLDELERQLSEITRQLSGAETVRPTPVQRRLPIIVGGKGGRRTITAAIEFADEYNLAEPTLDRASAIRTALDRAAAERGRSPLRLSVMGGCVVGSDSADVAYRTAQRRGVTKSDARPEFSGTVEEVVAALRCYEQIGVDRVMLSHLVHEDVEMVHLLRSVADALH